MKTNTKTEDAVLLKAVNGDKRGPNEQVTIVVNEYDVIISQHKKAAPSVQYTPTTGNVHTKFVLLKFVEFKCFKRFPEGDARAQMHVRKCRVGSLT